jgi:ABC-type transport system substrate-binding protein
MNTTGHGIDVVAFPDVRVRQGIQRAINRAAIASDPAVWGYDPGVQLANGVVSPGKGSYDNSDISIPYDPTTALALFAAAGWTDTNGDHILDNGAGTNLRVIVYGASSNARVQRIVNDLSNIGGGGIGAQVSTTTTQNSANLKSIGWNSDYPDPENDLAPFVSGGLYSTRFHYTSAIFDAFFTTGQTTLDPVLRNAAFHAADYQIVITDAVAIPQYYGAMIPVLKKPYVHDLHFGKLGGYPHAFLKDVWMDFYLYLPLISR